MNGAGMPQSRAVGLGRAVLDSFPLVKFGAATNAGTTRGVPYPTYEDPEDPPKALDAREDVESGIRRSESRKAETRAKDGDQNLEMTAQPSGARSGHHHSESRASSLSYNPDEEHLEKDPEHHRHPSDQVRSLANGGAEASENDPSGADLLNQSAIGRETCPICIVDFENGDDIRVLPCEGRHQFHQACVDPWLLELSSSCPICRAGTLVVSCRLYRLLHPAYQSALDDQISPPLKPWRLGLMPIIIHMLVTALPQGAQHR